MSDGRGGTADDGGLELAEGSTGSADEPLSWAQIEAAGHEPVPTEQLPEDVVGGTPTACGEVGPPPVTARWVEWDEHTANDGLDPMHVGDGVLHVELQSNLVASVDVTGEWDLEVGGVRKTAAFTALQVPAGAKAVVALDLEGAWPAEAKLRAPAALVARFTVESSDEYGLEDEQWQTSPQEAHVHAPVLRVTTDGDGLRLLSQEALSHSDCLEGLATEDLAMRYPELDEDALAAVASGEIVEVAEWIPENADDAVELGGGK